jgi:hypothetical protein
MGARVRAPLSQSLSTARMQCVARRSPHLQQQKVARQAAVEAAECIKSCSSHCNAIAAATAAEETDQAPQQKAAALKRRAVLEQVQARKSDARTVSRKTILLSAPRGRGWRMSGEGIYSN